jgi:hypothetical protein
MNVTPEQARKLLEAEAKFVIKESIDPTTGKVVKKLPASTRKALEKIASGIAPDDALAAAEWASNKRELARKLGITPPTLYIYMSKPGAPKPRSNGKWNVPEAREFCKRKGCQKLRTQDDDLEEVSRGIESLPIREQLKAKLDLLRLTEEEKDAQIRAKLYKSTAEVNEHISRCNLLTVRELEKGLCHELPPTLEGCTAAEISDLILEKLREILTNLPTIFATHDD